MTKRIPLLLTTLLFLSFIAKTQNTYNEITLPELMKKKQAGDKNMLIVDVRTRGEYGDTGRSKQSNIGRIKDAINIPVQDFREHPEDVAKQLEAYKDKDIYLICSHSYRSRVASNVLVKSGFAHINNVQGGMTEWYRRYDELAPYRSAFLEKKISYNNISPQQLLTDLTTGKNVLLVGIRNTPRFFWDSVNVLFYSYYPSFKNAVYYNYADSSKVFDLVEKEKNRPVVLFNMVNNGAAELVERLSQKGLTNASFLVGGLYLFYEYAMDKQATDKMSNILTTQSNIRFVSPAVYCSDIKKGKAIQMIDIRHDSLYNKVGSGVKHDFKHVKGALNFFDGKGADEFANQFPDKKKEYVLITDDNNGLKFADALTKKGYKIAWLNGGIDRWEWYINNVESFQCSDSLE